MDHPAQAGSGQRPDTQPSYPALDVPEKAPPPAAVDAGSQGSTADDGNCELSDEDYAKYEPL